MYLKKLLLKLVESHSQRKSVKSGVGIVTVSVVNVDDSVENVEDSVGKVDDSIGSEDVSVETV